MKTELDIRFCMEHGLVPLEEDEGQLVVGMAEITGPAVRQVQSRLERWHKKNVVLRAVGHEELRALLASHAGRDKTDHLIEGFTEGGDSGSDSHTLDFIDQDAPVVNLVNSICLDGIRQGASDIHIESGTTTGRVRYRIDGVLRTVRCFDPARFSAIANRIKIMANLNIMENRLPQDGRICVDSGTASFDLRVSLVPVSTGESIVLRMLNRDGRHRELESLGFTPLGLAAVHAALRQPHGLVLVTGPTGSGKTSALNAMLRYIHNDKLKIITIEDPVEMVMDGLDQIQTNDQIGLTFETILRRVLRQDPDVIMVGEIRDLPTAELVVRTALTGHLVLSTLHTNDAVSAISRLRNIGIEPYLITSVLRLVVAQRLVRTLCPVCKMVDKPNRHEQRILDSWTAVHPESIAPVQIARATGCVHCGGSGFGGRRAVFELFTMTEDIEELVLSSCRPGVIAEHIRSTGMQVLAVQAMELVAQGLTTLEEIEREVGW